MKATTRIDRLRLAEALVERGYDPDSPKATPGVLADFAAETGLSIRTLQRAMNDYRARPAPAAPALGFWDIPPIAAAHNNKPLERAPPDRGPKIRPCGWFRIIRGRCSEWQARFLPYDGGPWVEERLDLKFGITARTYAPSKIAYRRVPVPEQNATAFGNPVLPVRTPDWTLPCIPCADKGPAPRIDQHIRTDWVRTERGRALIVRTLLAGRVWFSGRGTLPAAVDTIWRGAQDRGTTWHRYCPVSLGRVTWDTVGPSSILWCIGDARFNNC